MIGCGLQKSATAPIGGSHRTCLTLNPHVDIFLTEDGHDFNGIAINAVVDTVHTTHATPVAFADIINGLIRIRLFRQLLESIKKSVVILISKHLAILTNAVPVDSLKSALASSLIL